MMFTGIGGAMLIVVLVFYLKTIGKRAKARATKSQARYIVEKAEILESAGNIDAALNVINEGLKQQPDEPLLMEKQRQLREN